MKKNAKRVISAICAAVISAAPMSVIAMEIPNYALLIEYIEAKETGDAQKLETLAMLQDLVGDALDEVANSSTPTSKTKALDKIVDDERYSLVDDRIKEDLKGRRTDSYNPSAYSVIKRILYDVYRVNVSRYKDRTFDLDVAATKNNRYYNCIFEYVENGGSLAQAIKTYLDLGAIIQREPHEYGIDSRTVRGSVGQYLLCEAHDRYLAKQAASKPVTDVNTTAPTTTGEKNINVYVDNKAVEFDVKPLIINDRTMIPIRKVANAIGITDDNVMYDGASRKAVFASGTQTVILTIDNATASVNGEDVQLDTPATIVSDRTLVPLRFIGETFGYKVDYTDDGTNLNVYLSKSTSTAPTLAATPTPLPTVDEIIRLYR